MSDSTGDKKPQFALQRIYAKDISFEAPGAPQGFHTEWKPDIKVQFSNAAQLIGDSVYEVSLQVSVQVSNAGKVVYIVEVVQAGLFLIDAPEQALEALLGAQCPSILFPYVRSLITDLISRGTFPQFALQPINFDAVYMEARRRQQTQAVAEADAAAKH